MFKLNTHRMIGLAFLLPIFALISLPCLAKEETEKAQISSSIGGDGTGTFIVEARGTLPELPIIFSANVTTNVIATAETVQQDSELAIEVVQGKAKTISLGINGSGDVIDVQSDSVLSWSVRQKRSKRFLDLQLKEDTSTVNAKIKIRESKQAYSLPEKVNLTHLSPGEAVGFNSIISIQYKDVEGVVTKAQGFAPLENDKADDDDAADRFQSTTGGKITLSLRRSGSTPDPIELVDTSLKGELHPNGKSIRFRLTCKAIVAKAGAKIDILSGRAAISEMPSDQNFRLQLVHANPSRPNEHAAYQLVFKETGTFPVTLDFVAALRPESGSGKLMDFTIAAGAIVPITINGLDEGLQFQLASNSVVPLRKDESWVGFLPASGRAKLQWKAARKTGEGKLFFTSNALVEARVGSGLLRQDHQIEYQVLQGELKSLSVTLKGPGEILDVQGNNLIAWKVLGEAEDRRLEITLSQPITGNSQFKIRSQSSLGGFPTRIEGLSLSPVGAIRHSGYLRVTNAGLVRLEPVGLKGLTQLSPDQFPGGDIKSRQKFVYRFPAANHSFTIAADRIQPEVSLSELVRYQFAETERSLYADIELDVREAPIRQWDFRIPADYSVVAVTGAAVADYIVGTEVSQGKRDLKIVFANDVSGRQLVSMNLEKSQAGTSGDWKLPRIEYPGAKAVRGDIGIIGAPGFRIVVKETDLLIEKPLSYFPKPSPDLQQAFRIRQPEWSATMRIELLDRSVQCDVFHLYSLSEEMVYGSALINFFVTGSPVSEWKLSVPESLGNVMVDGQDVRTWRREGSTLIVSLHQPVMGAQTLLVTFQEEPKQSNGTFRAGQVAPIDVQGERGFIHVVSPKQVEIETVSMSDDLLKLDALELPAEFRLLSTAPALGTWQYTRRPFDLNLKVKWFEPGTTVDQIVEFSEANSRVSQDGELVTDVVYFVKSRGGRTLKIKLPEEPVRLWAVSVNGQPVTARATDDSVLIPLPGSADLNTPVQVSLRLGKPSVNEARPELMLPIVFAPVLKTQWYIVGEEQYVLVPRGGTVAPAVPVLPPSGFSWLATRGITSLILIGLFIGVGFWGLRQSGIWRVAGLLGLVIAIWFCVTSATAAYSETGPPSPLQLSLPILSAGETARLQVSNTPLWRVNVSWFGLIASVAGIAAVFWSLVSKNASFPWLIRFAGLFLVAIGVLMQGHGASWFFGLLGIAILTLFLLPTAWQSLRRSSDWWRSYRQSKVEPVTAAMVAFFMLLGSAGSLFAEKPSEFATADSIDQKWQVNHRESRLTASGTIKLSGQPGDRFLFLKTPAVLTRFEGEGLRLNVDRTIKAYVISIPVDDDQAAEEDAKYEATFEFQLDAAQPIEGIPVLTGAAAVRQIDFRYDETGWDVECSGAVQIETKPSVDSTQANVILGPGDAILSIKPSVRDVSSESTQFFVEGTHLYQPGPGVVDGRHRISVRTSQGQVSSLSVLVPEGLTVSDVSGPVGSWQFDADERQLKIEVEPSQSKTFDVRIQTQRGLDPLPTEVTLSPLRVADANGEVGLVGIAFGAEAQPEKMVASGMSPVNLGDFDAKLIPNKQAVLNRVYRYGADAADLVVRALPVAPEVRLISKQVLSLGDERIVLGVNFVADITRAGLFQLSFPLPPGLEVESLSGSSLHHWSELEGDKLAEGDKRQVILHLNGKTIGRQSFAMTLSGVSPINVVDKEIKEWQIPRFSLNEANRQTGELVVRPTTGIRLRTVSKRNISETDARTLGSQAKGSLAFRLLQADWSLNLGIEKLDPWITGQVLHEVTLREGQTRTTLVGNFEVQNASINSLLVTLPIVDEDETKTVRATGDTVSDFVRTSPKSDTWEIQLKRRVIGKVNFRIEYERRGDRQNEREQLLPVDFPDARQVAYNVAVRAGGRLELEHDVLSQGWQRIDWNMVPPALRQSESRSAPAFALRVVAPSQPLVVKVARHSLADALKLRVAKGALTTILSSTGDQLTAVDLTVAVIQRSSLSVQLPEDSELLSLFVNGESVNSIRQGEATGVWQFNVVPGIDDSAAKVRFVYTTPGNRLGNLQLSSPQLSVPLENIQWNVVAPPGFELTDNDGNLELTRKRHQETYDRQSYLSKVSGKRQVQAQAAAELLDQANQLLQAGEQSKARRALSSVANQYALDAASNEDARVQLENLQTQQAIVGLNTRRQRFYLDNNRSDVANMGDKQIRDAAASNPILQQDQLNFRPQQLSQLLQGNTKEDNAILSQIAGRLVQHQRTSQPAPQAIVISLPEEGSVYTFSRSVQVTENAALELDLDFGKRLRIQAWQFAAVLLLLTAFAALFAFPLALARSR